MMSCLIERRNHISIKLECTLLCLFPSPRYHNYQLIFSLLSTCSQLLNRMTTNRLRAPHQQHIPIQTLPSEHLLSPSRSNPLLSKEPPAFPITMTHSAPAQHEDPTSTYTQQHLLAESDGPHQSLIQNNLESKATPTSAAQGPSFNIFQAYSLMASPSTTQPNTSLAFNPVLAKAVGSAQQQPANFESHQKRDGLEFYCSPTFNALAENAQAIDNYNFQLDNGRPSQRTQIDEDNDELCLVEGVTPSQQPQLMQQPTFKPNSGLLDREESGFSASYDAAVTKTKLELSFHNGSDFLGTSRQKGTEQGKTPVSGGPTTPTTILSQLMMSKTAKGAAGSRTRQISSITEQTIGSTQHSDDQNAGAVHPIDESSRVQHSSTIERVSLRRNLSINDRESLNARSRGISEVSNDLNLVNRTQCSQSSNELDSSLLNQQSQAADTRFFADKVRRVTFQGSAGGGANNVQTPEVTKERDGDASSDNQSADNQPRPSTNGASHLSPYQHKVANRRSHSYSREPRSPSWHNGNFDSSARSSQSRDTAELKSASNASEANNATIDDAALSEKDLGDLSHDLNLLPQLQKPEAGNENSKGQLPVDQEVVPGIYSQLQKHKNMTEPIGTTDDKQSFAEEEHELCMSDDEKDRTADSPKEAACTTGNSLAKSGRLAMYRKSGGGQGPGAAQRPKELKRSDFTAGNKIGDGAYGTVFKVQFTSPQTQTRVTSAKATERPLYALKEMLVSRFVNEGRIKEVFIERCILATLDHPSIIKFYHSFKNQNKLYLLVEFCQRGSLLDFLKRQGSLSNELTKHLVAEIVVSLEYLRSKEVIHRDLKPGNIVLDQGYHVKLIDFATCKVLNKEIQGRIAAFRSKNDLLSSLGFKDDSDLNMGCHDARMNSLVGTEEYLAPETLSDMGELSYTCDYWSLGCILYQLLSGTTPFKGRSDLETYHNIQKCHEIKWSKPSIDPLAKDLITKLLTKEPTLRLGFVSIDEIKSHPYFSGVDWATIRESKVPYNPPQMRRLARPVRLHKQPNMSSSFSNTNNMKSSLLQSPMSDTGSLGPCASPSAVSRASDSSGNDVAFFGPHQQMKKQQSHQVQLESSFTYNDTSDGPKPKPKQNRSFAVAPSTSSKSLPFYGEDSGSDANNQSREETKISTKKQGASVLLRGTLRKKGLIFMNERDVTLNSAGVINYYHFDKPGVVKGNIDLTSSQIHSVRFSFASGSASPQKTKKDKSLKTQGSAAQASRPSANVDDEFRIYLQNRECFLFRASKIMHGRSENPTIERWERAIRKFNKNVRIDF